MTSFRLKRFGQFVELMGLVDRPKNSVRILDVGGCLQYWTALEVPASVSEVLIVNLDQGETRQGRFRVTYGNGCSLAFADNSFDIAHSNSVIEHVGHWSEMQAMAAEVRRVAPRYFVQTPNLWFPLEMHYRLPFAQFLPEDWRARLIHKHRRGWVGPCPDYASAMQVVQTINLLCARQMHALFPDAEHLRERFCGITKSLIAVR